MKTVTIPPTRIVQILIGIELLLIIASIAGQFSVFIIDHPRSLGLPPMFYLEDEYNIPTYFSSFLLGMAAFLLGLIAFSEEKGEDHFRRHWIFLAALFLFFSIDEAICLHERLNMAIRNIFGWKELVGWRKFFFSTWIVPGTIFSIILVLNNFRFFLQLPKRTKHLFFLAALICFSGVIGIELITILYRNTFGPLNFNYTMIVTVEETLEMSGVILFIYALLDTINQKGLTIQFKK
ncbi:hypothetical protein JW824_05455 [bacterium]|nr:hypothetical protein [bacterium]RQV96323.1 MAG: hypothetical protein EH221_04960 [bacterium]